MGITVTTEQQFESDIETFLISAEGGYAKGHGTYSPKLGLYPDKLVSFIQRTQPREWAAFERQNAIDPVRKYCVAFHNACDMDGVLYVLRNGFKHRGITFKVCYFKPESALNDMAGIQHAEMKSSAIGNGIILRIRKSPWMWRGFMCWRLIFLLLWKSCLQRRNKHG